MLQNDTLLNLLTQVLPIGTTLNYQDFPQVQIFQIVFVFCFFGFFFCCYCCCCCFFFDSLILITTVPKVQTIRVILELNLRSEIFIYTFSLCFKPIFSAGSKIYLHIFTIFFMFVCFLNLLSTCFLFVFNQEPTVKWNFHTRIVFENLNSSVAIQCLAML